MRTDDKTRDVDAYIAAAPPAARSMLRQLRQLIRSCAPQAEERLSYRMPYYSFHGRLVYFAAFSKHVSVYLMGRSKDRFARELEPYRTTPSTLHFPFGSRVPVALLKRVIKARLEENLAAAASGRKRSGREARPRLRAQPESRERSGARYAPGWSPSIRGEDLPEENVHIGHSALDPLPPVAHEAPDPRLRVVRIMAAVHAGVDSDLQ
jgi:uncharacterized protein YdhG (YjbR/CyaY superfamily)